MTSLLVAGLFALSVAPEADVGRPGLDSVGWLVGRWRSADGERAISEEHWSAPAAGGMVGMFRMTTRERAGVYELLLLEQQNDGVWMRMRHFRPQMVAMEQEPISLKLTSAGTGKLIFENPKDNRPKRITYEVNDDKLVVTVETERNGQPTSFTVKMSRVK